MANSNSVASTKAEAEAAVPYDFHDFIFYVNKNRLNSLFKVMQADEDRLQAVFDNLELLQLNQIARLAVEKGEEDRIINKNEISMANNLVNARRKKTITKYMDLYRSEIQKNLVINKQDRSVSVHDRFAHSLKQLSVNYSFRIQHDKQGSSKQEKDETKVIVLAYVVGTNSISFKNLVSTVANVLRYYSNCPVIIYDIGLTEELINQIRVTIERCDKCEIRTFDAERLYSNVAEHVLDLKTNAWKPLIVAEVLRHYDNVVLIDSPIAFTALDKLDQLIESSRKVGMVAYYKQQSSSLACYTNPKTFKWFKEIPNLFTNINMIDTNVMVFHNSFVTSLIMKAWVTCALSKDCLTPEGSSRSGTGSIYASLTGSCKYCGCHRYDQSAISIISTFFYGYPKHSEFFSPAFAFTKNEIDIFFGDSRNA